MPGHIEVQRYKLFVTHANTIFGRHDNREPKKFFCGGEIKNSHFKLLVPHFFTIIQILPVRPAAWRLFAEEVE